MGNLSPYEAIIANKTRNVNICPLFLRHPLLILNLFHLDPGPLINTENTDSVSQIQATKITNSNGKFPPLDTIHENSFKLNAQKVVKTKKKKSYKFGKIFGDKSQKPKLNKDDIGRSIGILVQNLTTRGYSLKRFFQASVTQPVIHEA